MTLFARFCASAVAIVLLIVPWPVIAQADTGGRPGDFEYYALVLSWSPTYCLGGNGSREGDPQCGSSRPYAFVLHGLWPQYDKGWPESCQPADLPAGLARSMLDIMPSDRLVAHEYEKHGTCSGLDAQSYFGLARKLFDSIRIPAKFANLSAPLQLPLDELRRDLLAANGQLGPDMIAVNCDKHGELVEVHFCFTKDGHPKSCGRNEVQARMCRQDMVTLPPVRGHAVDAGADQPASATPEATADAPVAAATQTVPNLGPGAAMPNAAGNAGASGSFNANEPTSGQAPDAQDMQNADEEATRHRHRRRHHHRSYYND